LKPKLSSNESFALYGVVLSFILLFYLLGLFVGRSHFVEAKPNEEVFSLSAEPVEDPKSGLGFYDRVMISPDTEQNEPIDALLPPSRQNEEQTGGSSVKVEEPILEVYTVQVGAFTSREEAHQMLVRLEAKGYSGVLSPPAGQDPHYRVGVGEYGTDRDARATETLLRKDGFLTYIKKIKVARQQN